MNLRSILGYVGPTPLGRIRVGQVVHVLTHERPDEPPVCWPALVLIRGESTLCLRVIHPTPGGAPIGQYDAEAWYRGVAVTYANRDGTTRQGDTWHAIDDCTTGA